MAGAFIDDGYTGKKTIEAVPGLHPKVVVQYRPAESEDRTVFAYCRDAKTHSKLERELLDRCLVTVDGEKPQLDRIKKLWPDVFATCVNLVLGYAGGDEEAVDLKN